MSTMKSVVIQIIGGAAVLYTFWQSHILTGQLTIVVALIAIVFMLCFLQLDSGLYPMKNALAEMQKWLKENHNFIPLHEVKPTGYVAENSPIKNTPLGEQLLDESGAKKMVDENYPNFERRIDEQKCLTAYDVQAQSSRIISQIENEKIMKPIKDFVYQHPRFHETPLTLADAQRVMLVYLRELYLEKHPAILSDEESKQ